MLRATGGVPPFVLSQRPKRQAKTQPSTQHIMQTATSSSTHAPSHSRAHTRARAQSTTACTKPQRQRRPASAHGSMANSISNMTAGPGGFAPSSSLRPALPLSIDISLAQIALPPSSLVHKPAMVLPIAIDSDDNLVTQEDDPVAMTTQLPSESSSSHTQQQEQQEQQEQHFNYAQHSAAALRASASSPSLLDLHFFSQLRQDRNSANVTPRPSDQSPSAKHRRRQSTYSAQPQQEVLALLSASTLDTVGIISSSPTSSSPAMSPPQSRSASSARLSALAGSTSMVASSSSSSSSTYNHKTRPECHRSPSVTSFASDGSWHGDAGDWDPEQQLKTAVDLACRRSAKSVLHPSASSTSSPSPFTRHSSINPIFRTIGTGFGLVSSGVQCSRQREEDDSEDSDHDQHCEDDDEFDEEEGSSVVDSMFSSVAHTHRDSFTFSQSDCAESSSVASSRSHRFRAIGQGLTPLTADDSGRHKLKQTGKHEASTMKSTLVPALDDVVSSQETQELDAPAASSSSRLQSARDSIKEHAGPFIWLLTSLLDPVSSSSESSSSLSAPQSLDSSPDLSSSAAVVTTASELEEVDDDDVVAGGVASKRRSWGRGKKEEYLFGSRSAWTAAADVDMEVERKANSVDGDLDIVLSTDDIEEESSPLFFLAPTSLPSKTQRSPSPFSTSNPTHQAQPHSCVSGFEAGGRVASVSS
ncbi:hypothetical protein A4X13_0g133 [Tilletia indica]|uniref:Uncharacterized protein n=1 Tax=Tilletia indica TaxID=43049 RepID=A0A8T8TIJ5_9BASI|nr:hypothetical protein A4X13_0g133 [Tilletia indica]